MRDRRLAVTVTPRGGGPPLYTAVARERDHRGTAGLLAHRPTAVAAGPLACLLWPSAVAAVVDLAGDPELRLHHPDLRLDQPDRRELRLHRATSSPPSAWRPTPTWSRATSSPSAWPTSSATPTRRPPRAGHRRGRPGDGAARDRGHRPRPRARPATSPRPTPSSCKLLVDGARDPRGKTTAVVKATIIDDAQIARLARLAAAAAQPRARRRPRPAARHRPRRGARAARHQREVRRRHRRDHRRPRSSATSSRTADAKRPAAEVLGTATPWAEAFRVLRTNMQYVDVDNDQKVFVRHQLAARRGQDARPRSTSRSRSPRPASGWPWSSATSAARSSPTASSSTAPSAPPAC